MPARSSRRWPLSPTAFAAPPVTPSGSNSPRRQRFVERGRARWRAELVAAPEALIAELGKANRVVSKPVPLGRVGLGIVMRAGSPAIDVSTAPALRAALLAAKTVVYNRASSGQGIEALIMKLGLTEQLASRTVRFPTPNR